MRVVVGAVLFVDIWLATRTVMSTLQFFQFAAAALALARTWYWTTSPVVVVLAPVLPRQLFRYSRLTAMPQGWSQGSLALREALWWVLRLVQQQDLTSKTAMLQH